MKKIKNPTVDEVVEMAFDIAERKNFSDLCVVVTIGALSHLVWLQRKGTMAARLTELMKSGGKVEAVIGAEQTALGHRFWSTAMDDVPAKRAGILLRNFYSAMTDNESLAAFGRTLN